LNNNGFINSKIIEAFKILAQNKEIPIFTTDEELTTILCRDNQNEGKYIPLDCGMSNKLINISDNDFSRFTDTNKVSIPFIDEDYDFNYLKKRDL